MSTSENSKDDIALDVKNVSKWFKLYHDTARGPVKAALAFWNREQYYRRFKAIDDVSFTARRGEVIGIVGPNGAGKSTLLKMIAGLLPVDEGSITVCGKITALLALGMGIHPEFSGRENIFYNGLLLGMSKAEIDAKTADIIDFAEIDEYINHPFRTYSSGMRARLLFAISMAVNPDIMIIDEALATGDNYFLQKCQRKVKEMCESGATVLFVTHNLLQAMDLTDRCIYLKSGAVVFDGDTRNAIDTYVADIYEETSRKIQSHMDRNRKKKTIKGTGEIVIHDAYFVVKEARTSRLIIGENAELHIEISTCRDIDDCTVHVRIFSDKSPVTYAFVQLFDYSGPTITVSNVPMSKGRKKVILKFANIAIGDGVYQCNIEFHPCPPKYKYSEETLYCGYDDFLSFHAIYKNNAIFGRGTLCEIPVNEIKITDV